MPQISENTIELIRTTADIVDVISSYIELKKKGRNFFGLCPFHGEKTPSFSVNQEKQIYKCFGCGTGGGVINFIMEIETLNFIDAITKLAQRYNIKIESTQVDIRSRNLKDQLIEINELSAEYYHKQLFNEKNKKVLEYLKNRHFNEETINLFKLGFSDKNSSQLLEFLQKKKFTSEAMKQSGLFINGDKGYFDRFYSRLIFPISDMNSNVIAFAGRSLDKNNQAKYINSIETPIYNKSKVFYGLDLAKKKILDEKYAILVEGYFDLMRLYQSGIKNVLAISGTAFTDMHASIIKQYSSNIMIAFDGDLAGKKASIRTGYTLLRNSINPKIISIPDNLDPDDWVQNEGADKFLNTAKKAVPIINFHYNYQISNENQPINEFINDSITEISLIKDPIFRELTAKNLSEIININEEKILVALNDKLSKKRRFNKQTALNDITNNLSNNNSNTFLEHDLLRLCLSKELSIRQLIFDYMQKDWFQSEDHKKIYEIIYIHLNSESEIPTDVLINNVSEKNIRDKFTDLILGVEGMAPTKGMVLDCLIQLEKRVLKKGLMSLKNSLKSAQENDIPNIIKKITSTEKVIQDISSKYKE